MTVLKFDTTFDFGKHLGKKVSDILVEDPGYLLFLRRKGTNSKINYDMDLHCALDAMLYAVGVSASSADQPKYPREVSDAWVARQSAKVQEERNVEAAEAARLTEQRKEALAAGNSTYSAWGAW